MSEGLIQEQIDEIKKCRNCQIELVNTRANQIYWLDGYCPETNTVYEVYESWHSKNKERDIRRQKEIQQFLNCNFEVIYAN